MGACNVSRTQLQEIAEDLGFGLDPTQLEAAAGSIDGLMQSCFRRIDALPDYLPPVRYPRGSWSRPQSHENPLNAWAVKGRIRGAAGGLLAGRAVVLKDNIAVAGFPMTNGASALDGYTPEYDATIVGRLLDAGAEIIGKAHCEYYCVSGGSNTNPTGLVRNPHDPSRTTGGSSSGCAALVGSGEVDLAIGGDQGGSIRVPSSFCGVYGMKPTFGLVPYTGIFPIDQTLDYAGPMTTTTRDNALLLQVIAGPDGLDPRQSSTAAADYLADIDGGVAGVKIGFLTEGFGWVQSEAEVERAVNALREQLRSGGATVVDVSVPMHRDGFAIWIAIVLEGFAATMRDNALGTQWRGFYSTSLGRAHSNWRGMASALPDNVRLLMLAGEYLTRTYGGHYYGKAQNLSRQLRDSYDQAFADVDVLVMPTAPFKAPPLPPESGATPEQLDRPGLASIVNSSPFDCSGHPAINVPVGIASGLPIGAMLVGRYFEERELYKVSQFIETQGSWRDRDFT